MPQQAHCVLAGEGNSIGGSVADSASAAAAASALAAMADPVRRMKKRKRDAKRNGQVGPFLVAAYKCACLPACASTVAAASHCEHLYACSPRAYTSGLTLSSCTESLAEYAT